MKLITKTVHCIKMTRVMLLRVKLTDKKSVCIYDMISRFAFPISSSLLLVTLSISRDGDIFSGQEVMLIVEMKRLEQLVHLIGSSDKTLDLDKSFSLV